MQEVVGSIPIGSTKPPGAISELPQLHRHREAGSLRSMMFAARLLIILVAAVFGAQPVLCAEMPVQPRLIASEPCHHGDEQQPQMPDQCPHQIAGMQASAATAALIAPSPVLVSYFVAPLFVAALSKTAGRRTAASTHPPFRSRTLFADRMLLRI